MQTGQMVQPTTLSSRNGVGGSMGSRDRFESVLAAARLGEQWAWERLITPLDATLRGYVKSLGSHDIEDAVGDIWLAVVRGLASFSGDEAAFRAWVFSIAYRRSVDQHRRLVRRDEVEVEPADLELAADLGQSAEDHAMRHYDEEAVLAALEKLTFDQRQVVTLRFLVGMSLVEIAEVTGRRAGAVQSLQTRAFKQLEKILGDPRK